MHGRSGFQREEVAWMGALLYTCCLHTPFLETKYYLVGIKVKHTFINSSNKQQDNKVEDFQIDGRRV